MFPIIHCTVSSFGNRYGSFGSNRNENKRKDIFVRTDCARSNIQKMSARIAETVQPHVAVALDVEQSESARDAARAQILAGYSILYS